MITKAELQEIEARANAATEEPWGHDLNGFIALFGNEGEWGRTIVKVPSYDYEKDSQDRRNADFIAHARSDIPRLIAAIRELQQQAQDLVAEVRRAQRVEDFAKNDRAVAQEEVKSLRAQLASQQSSGEVLVSVASDTLEWLAYKQDGVTEVERGIEESKLIERLRRALPGKGKETQ